MTDATGITSPLTKTYTNIAENQLCLDLTIDPIPDVCAPFQVSATASNFVTGTSTITSRRFPSNSANKGMPC